MDDRPMASVLDLRDIAFVRSGKTILEDITWRVPSMPEAQEHWVVVGKNGAGKTTLLKMVAATLWPTRGLVTVLGERFGRVDLRELRKRIGWVSSALSMRIPFADTVGEVVMSGLWATLGLTYVEPTAADRDRAARCLALFGLEAHADQSFGTLSQGEQQKALIARSLLPEPDILILDEPCAGLDLAAREDLLANLGRLAQAAAGPTLILVTHHIEEIPALFTHGLVLKAGRVLRSGPLDAVLCDVVLTEAFGLPVVVEQRDGRYWARLAT